MPVVFHYDISGLQRWVRRQIQKSASGELLRDAAEQLRPSAEKAVAGLHDVIIQKMNAVGLRVSARGRTSKELKVRIVSEEVSGGENNVIWKIALEAPKYMFDHDEGPTITPTGGRTYLTVPFKEPDEFGDESRDPDESIQLRDDQINLLQVFSEHQRGYGFELGELNLHKASRFILKRGKGGRALKVPLLMLRVGRKTDAGALNDTKREREAWVNAHGGYHKEQYAAWKKSKKGDEPTGSIMVPIFSMRKSITLPKRPWLQDSIKSLQEGIFGRGFKVKPSSGMLK